LPRDAGKVSALTDSQGRGIADKVRVIASGLESPVGVAFQQGDLHVSAVNRIVVLRDIEKSFAPLSTDSVGTLAQDHTFAREACRGLNFGRAHGVQIVAVLLHIRMARTVG
jgi:glucose/arabinose dehydrogenase